MTRANEIIRMTEELYGIDEEDVKRSLFESIRHLMRASDVKKFLKLVAKGGVIAGIGTTIILLPYVQHMFKEIETSSNAIDFSHKILARLKSWGIGVSEYTNTEKMAQKIRAAIKIIKFNLLRKTVKELVSPVPDTFKNALKSGEMQVNVKIGMAVGGLLSLLSQFSRMSNRIPKNVKASEIKKVMEE